MLLAAKPTDIQASEDVSGKILIVGGGSGAIMALSRIHRAIKNPDITIIAPNEIHLFQPGQIFVAAGVVNRFDKIEGLTEEDIGTNGIGCVYLSDLEKGTARGATEM